MIVFKEAMFGLAQVNDLFVPEGSKFIHADEQHGQMTVWFLCDPGRPKVTRRLIVYGTGHQIPQEVSHIATVVTAGGFLIWHVFEVLS